MHRDGGFTAQFVDRDTRRSAPSQRGTQRSEFEFDSVHRPCQHAQRDHDRGGGSEQRPGHVDNATHRVGARQRSDDSAVEKVAEGFVPRAVVVKLVVELEEVVMGDRTTVLDLVQLGRQRPGVHRDA